MFLAKSAPPTKRTYSNSSAIHKLTWIKLWGFWEKFLLCIQSGKHDCVVTITSAIILQLWCKCTRLKFHYQSSIRFLHCSTIDFTMNIELTQQPGRRQRWTVDTLLTLHNQCKLWTSELSRECNPCRDQQLRWKATAKLGIFELGYDLECY